MCCCPSQAFVSYASIPTMDDFCQQVHFSSKLGDVKGSFFVLEKVHGCNLSFLRFRGQKPGTLYCARRNGLLLEGENFYNFQSRLETKNAKYLWKNISSLLDHVLAEFSQATHVQMYGEFFGGICGDERYPDGAPPVQTRIHYGPFCEYAAFDVRIGTQIPSDQEPPTYLDYRKFIHLCNQFQVPTVPVLAECKTIHEVSKIKVRRETGVSKLFGYPYIENIHPDKKRMEGIVIRPSTSSSSVRIKSVNFPSMRKMREFRRTQYHKKRGVPLWVEHDVRKNTIRTRFPVCDFLTHSKYSLFNKIYFKTAEKKERRKQVVQLCYHLLNDLWDKNEISSVIQYIRKNMHKSTYSGTELQFYVSEENPFEYEPWLRKQFSTNTQPNSSESILIRKLGFNLKKSVENYIRQVDYAKHTPFKIVYGFFVKGEFNL